MDDAAIPDVGVDRPLAAHGRSADERSIRVLWADDEVERLHPLVEILRAEGIHVHRVCDGKSALGVARRLPWDLILLDLRLPDMSGIEVLKDLRRHDVSMPVVILTGHPTDIDEATARTFDARIAGKPIRASKLAELLHEEVARGGSAPATRAFRRPDGRSSGACEDLLVLLRRKGRDPGSRVDHAGLRDDLLGALAVALAADVTFFEWLALTRAFAGLMTRPLAMSPILADRLAQDLGSACGPGTADRDVVLRVVACIEAAGAGWRTLTLTDVASSLRIDERQIESSLRRAGFASFEHCRRAVVVRRALLELALTGEHVDQIAFAVGYEHRNALNRDFRALLKVAPKAYRAIFAGGRRRPDAAM